MCRLLSLRNAELMACPKYVECREVDRHVIVDMCIRFLYSDRNFYISLVHIPRNFYIPIEEKTDTK